MRKILSSMMLALIMLTVSFVLTMGTDAWAHVPKKKKPPKATVGIEESNTAPEYQLLAKAAPKKK
jgi:hypothetical protein